MIKLIRKNGKTCPVMMCDICNKRIVDVGEGMAFFSSLEEGDVSYKICHKNTCDTGEPMSMELSHFLLHLLSNVGLTGKKLREAKEGASWL